MGKERFGLQYSITWRLERQGYSHRPGAEQGKLGKKGKSPCIAKAFYVCIPMCQLSCFHPSPHSLLLQYSTVHTLLKQLNQDPPIGADHGIATRCGGSGRSPVTRTDPPAFSRTAIIAPPLQMAPPLPICWPPSPRLKQQSSPPPSSRPSSSPPQDSIANICAAFLPPITSQPPCSRPRHLLLPMSRQQSPSLAP